MKNKLLRYAYPLAAALFVAAIALFYLSRPGKPAAIGPEHLQAERSVAGALLEQWKQYGFAGPQTRTDSLAAALDLYQSNRYPDAGAALRQYLTGYPADSIAQFYLALSALYQEDYQTATRLLSRLSELDGFGLRDDARWYWALAATNVDPQTATGLLQQISRDTGSRHRQSASEVLAAIRGNDAFHFGLQPAAGATTANSALVLVVQQPWWQNPWARALLLLLPACSLALILWQNRLKRQHRAEIENEVARRTETLRGQKESIEREKERSEEILLNILPSETAEELKKYGHSDTRRYDRVTVLFCDFQEFTRISEQLSPEDLVASLGECFEAYDRIVTTRGLEKIKTVGDCYICAGGLNNPEADSALQVVRAAQEMLEFLKAFNARQSAAGKPAFEARIGIHTGTVVAGIVGIKKYAYDIWGDTVNIAARMEQNSEGGRINISDTTYELVREHLSCQYRGKVEAKGKGAVDMYFVE